MKKRWIIISVIIAVVLIAAITVGPIMSNVETPKYKIIKSEDIIEIRKYDPIIIAEVQTKGNRKNSITEGFRLLADYIFGNNTNNHDISMTAPVQQQKNTKIAMTSPVQQQSMGDNWLVSFVMPSEYKIDTLPKPINERISLKEIPAKTFVVVSFSGINSDNNMQKHEKILQKYIENNDLSVIGAPIYAFYNPPWTLPILRRNEIMFEIKY